jgi:gluconate 2-dehydrogenase gamma chain
METRRETLKIIGAVGGTCAFPFSADELYGQHAHPPPVQIQAAPGPYQPKFFTEAECKTISRIADLIIPPTDTPGAVDAGAPRYIDDLVSKNAEHQQAYRAGLQWLAGQKFDELTEEQQIALLAPLCEAADRGEAKTPAEIFFRKMKNMTADAYYTSQAGLVQELQYKGNTVLARFPECHHPEHRGE